jgi:hypothetical protein
MPFLFTWSNLKHSNTKPTAALNSRKTPLAAVHPIKGQPNEPASQESRNKASTIRNSVKIERYLTEVEKIHGFSKSWELRERLEQGQLSFDELLRRSPIFPMFGS